MIVYKIASPAKSSQDVYSFYLFTFYTKVVLVYHLSTGLSLLILVLIPGSPSPPLRFLFQGRPRPPPRLFTLSIHLLQESLHSLFSLVNSKTTSTDLPSRSPIRNETLSSA